MILIVWKNWKEKRENGCTCTLNMCDSDRYIYIEEIFTCNVFLP